MAAKISGWRSAWMIVLLAGAATLALSACDADEAGEQVVDLPTLELDDVIPEGTIEAPTLEFEDLVGDDTAYEDDELGVRYTHPADWEFVPQVEAWTFDPEASIGEACADWVEDSTYSADPEVEALEVDGQEACLVVSPDAEEESVLVVRLPEPYEMGGNEYPYVVVLGEEDQLRQIAATLAFD